MDLNLNYDISPSGRSITTEKLQSMKVGRPAGYGFLLAMASWHAMEKDE